MSSNSAIGSDSNRDHGVMLACALVGFSNLYCTQSIGGELHSLFGLSMSQSAALVGVTTLGLAIASPFVGLLVQRIGSRRVLISGFVLLGLLNACLAFATDFGVLVVLRSAQGAAMPMVLSSLLTSIERQPSTRAALGISATYVMGTICGGVLGRLLPAILVPGAGWEAAFLAMAALHVIACLLACSGFRLPKTPVAKAPPSAGGLAPLRLASVYAGGFAVLFSQMAVFTFVAFRLVAPPFSWHTAALGSLYLVFLPALGCVRVSRHAVTRLGHTKALAAAALVGWCGLLSTLTRHTPVVVAGLVLFSIAVFFAQTVLAHALSVAPAVSRARASGGYLFFYYLGGSIGAVAPTLVWADFGWGGCLGLVGAMQLGLVAVARRPPGDAGPRRVSVAPP